MQIFKITLYNFSNFLISSYSQFAICAINDPKCCWTLCIYILRQKEDILKVKYVPFHTFMAQDEFNAIIKQDTIYIQIQRYAFSFLNQSKVVSDIYVTPPLFLDSLHIYVVQDQLFHFKLIQQFIVHSTLHFSTLYSTLQYTTKYNLNRPLQGYILGKECLLNLMNCERRYGQLNYYQCGIECISI